MRLGEGQIWAELANRPTVLFAMLQDQDAERKERVMRAMLKMKKLDVGLLEDAYHHLAAGGGAAGGNRG